MWTEIPKGKNKKPVNKDRFISKMFLRYVLPFSSCNNLIVDSGDSVILSTFVICLEGLATDFAQFFVTKLDTCKTWRTPG